MEGVEFAIRIMVVVIVVVGVPDKILVTVSVAISGWVEGVAVVGVVADCDDQLKGVVDDMAVDGVVAIVNYRRINPAACSTGLAGSDGLVDISPPTPDMPAWMCGTPHDVLADRLGNRFPRCGAFGLYLILHQKLKGRAIPPRPEDRGILARFL